jgi:hypothetical protein
MSGHGQFFRGRRDLVPPESPETAPELPEPEPAPETKPKHQSRVPLTFEVFAALSGGVGEGSFAGCCTSFDEWQDATAFKARQAAQERKRLGLPPEVADPNDPMRRR